jgi:hypothetical protein
MITVTHALRNLGPLSIAAAIVCGHSALAQSAAQACRPAEVIPLTGTEPPAKLVASAPLAGPLASRGVVIIPYCAENLRFAPIFGPGGLSVSPRVGHLHVTLDGAPWHWADASGNPIIIDPLSPGRHTVLLELANPNHQIIDKVAVTFDVPKRAASK